MVLGSREHRCQGSTWFFNLDMYIYRANRGDWAGLSHVAKNRCCNLQHFCMILVEKCREFYVFDHRSGASIVIYNTFCSCHTGLPCSSGELFEPLCELVLPHHVAFIDSCTFLNKWVCENHENTDSSSLLTHFICSVQPKFPFICPYVQVRRP